MQTCMLNLYSDEKGNDDEIEDAGTSGKEGGQPWMDILQMHRKQLVFEFSFLYFTFSDGINSSQLRNC